MEEERKAKEQNGQSMRHKGLFAWIYGLALTAYAVFTLLYVFVIPHGRISMADFASATETSTEALTTGEKSETDNNETENNTSENNASDNNAFSGDYKSDWYKERKHGRKRPGSDDTDSDNTHDTHNADSDSAKSDDADSEPVEITTESYEEDGLDVTLTTEYIYNTKVYIATVAGAEGHGLTTGLAEDSFGRNVTEETSDIAARVGAVIAINGDFYGFRDEGYVIRNGYLYRDEKSSNDAEDLVVYSDGSMEIIKEGDITAQELLDKGAVQVYSFGPALVEDGEVKVSEGDEVGRAMGSNPRTSIGQTADGSYILVVSDGRTAESEGLSLAQLAEVMKNAGCVTAYNLDGGGSSTMYYNGEVVNNPTTNGNRISERKVSDIVYFR